MTKETSSLGDIAAAALDIISSCVDQRSLLGGKTRVGKKDNLIVAVAGKAGHAGGGSASGTLPPVPVAPNQCPV